MSSGDGFARINLTTSSAEPPSQRDASPAASSGLTLAAMAPLSDRNYFPPLEESLSGERVLL